MARLRVGLLGGSFNPAHNGHRHVSLLALQLLRLDQVWWLVSPQNPLKATAGMASLERRFERARELARHPRIRVSDLERELGTRYTADTLPALKCRFGRIAFVWLMGADNLVQIPAWRRWPEIFEAMPVAVFDRPTYSYRALAGTAAHRFRGCRVGRSWCLAGRKPPAWCFIRARPDPASATSIRQAQLWTA